MKNLLPSLNQKSKGQILVIFLLILVVGLTITLAIASRTITEVRISTSTEQASKAYFAAEAGVEEALKKLLTCDPIIPGDCDVTGTLETGYFSGEVTLAGASDKAYAFAN